MTEIPTAPEKWKPIKGYEQSYEASDQGRIRSIDRLVVDSLGRRRKYQGCILSPGAQPPSGHLHVNLKVGGGSFSRAVHAIVLETFVGPCPPGLECCHENGDPSDNRVSNLRWDTRSSNVQDALRHGTHSQASKTHCPHGHEYTAANTLPANGGRGRRCRECHRISSAERFAARTDVQHGTHRSSRKNHCKNGHPFDEQNTRISPRGRVCIACARASGAASRARCSARARTA